MITTRSFPGRYKSLSKIGKFIRNVAQEAGFGDFAVYSVEMAVDEACSNIIEHAYKGQEAGRITCTCEVNDDGLTIILKDTGLPFNPDSISPPVLSDRLEQRESHGLGLVFIRKWMDRVDFQTIPDDGNRLTLFKRRPSTYGKERIT